MGAQMDPAVAFTTDIGLAVARAAGEVIFRIDDVTLIPPSLMVTCLPTTTESPRMKSLRYQARYSAMMRRRERRDSILTMPPAQSW